MAQKHSGWRWTFCLAIAIACVGCSDSPPAGMGGTGGGETLDDAADVQRLFETVASDIAELLAQGLEEIQQKAYPDCPGGGTLSVDSSGMQATFAGCTISGITIDGSTTSLMFSRDFSTDVPPVLLSATVMLGGTFTISGALNGTVTVDSATFIWADPRVCWSAMGRVNSTIPFDVQSADQSCGQASTCGDSLVSGAEECDDGNNSDGDGCSSSCVFEFLACGASASQCLVGDEFEGSALDSAWAVDFIEADNWTFVVTGGELVVSEINSTLACNRYGESWSFARMSQTFAPVDDYRLVVTGSWDSGGPSAIQKLQVTLLGAGLTCQVVAQQHTHDLLVPACAMPGIANQLPGESATGTGTFVFESCNGELNVFYNGIPVISGEAQPVSSIQLWFGYYKVDDLETDPNVPCTPSGQPHSTFGEIRVDEVTFESPPPSGTPGIACGL